MNWLNKIDQGPVAVKAAFYAALILSVWVLAGAVAHQFVPPLGLDWIVVQVFQWEISHQWCRVVSFMLAAIVVHGTYAMVMRGLGKPRSSILFIVGITVLMTAFSDQIDFNAMAEQEGLSRFAFLGFMALATVGNFAEHVLYVWNKCKADVEVTA